MKEKNYDEIINCTPPKSKTHAPLTMSQRAAQFSPFAALTGYDESIEETAIEHEKIILALETGKMDLQ